MSNSDSGRRFAVDLRCGCRDPWYTGLFFDDVHLGFVCQSCLKEWLLEEFVQKTDESPICHGGKTYLSPIREQLEESPQCQVTTAREKIIPEYATDSLKPGDHIMWHRPELYWHHAIVESVTGDKVTLIHFTKDSPLSLSKSVMRCDEIDMQEETGTLYLVTYNKDVCHFNPVELVLARARALIGITDYNLLKKNCENFATFCRTGINSNQQSKWFFRQLEEALYSMSPCALQKSTKGIVNVVYAEGLEFSMKELSQVANLSELIGAGLIIAMEGYFCICNLDELFKKRKEVPEDGSPSLSRENFIAQVVEELSTRFFGGALGVAGGLAPLALPALGPFGACVLGIIAGSIGLVSGKATGKYLAPKVTRRIVERWKTSDRAVALNDLQPGDHVIFYGNALHPRCHAIITDIIREDSVVIVIRHSYQNGVIYDEILYKKKDPIFKVFYPKSANIYSPDEIITRAMQALDDKTDCYNILTNNCKHFVYSITLKS